MTPQYLLKQLVRFYAHIPDELKVPYSTYGTPKFYFYPLEPALPFEETDILGVYVDNQTGENDTVKVLSLATDEYGRPYGKWTTLNTCDSEDMCLAGQLLNRFKVTDLQAA